MRERMAMHNKAAHCNWIEMNPKSNRSKLSVINVGRKSARRRNYAGYDHSVVPFGVRKSLAIYLRQQKMILMNVKRVIAKRAIDHRPLFIVVGDRVVKQLLVWIEQTFLLKIDQRLTGIFIRGPLVIVITHHLEGLELGASPIIRVILGRVPTAAR